MKKYLWGPGHVIAICGLIGLLALALLGYGLFMAYTGWQDRDIWRFVGGLAIVLCWDHVGRSADDAIHTIKRRGSRPVTSQRDPENLRPGHGPCPGCGAGEKDWCRDGCPLIDPTDYR
jgi:hypothetical protein